MLILAGTGLHRGHLTLELIEALKTADKVYIDVYTMPNTQGIVSAIKEYAPHAVEATRSMLEDRATEIIEEARHLKIVITVSGHPLIATTHVSLLAEARARGVETRVIHGISGVVAAMTVSGLDFYKFGRTVTIPGPWRSVKPYSIVEYIYYNAVAGLHTLLLLDIDNEGRQLCLKEAKEVLLEVDRLGVLAGMPAVIVEDAGLNTERVWSTELGSIDRCQEGIASIVLPLGISRIEQEILEEIHGIKINNNLLTMARHKIIEGLRLV